MLGTSVSNYCFCYLSDAIRQIRRPIGIPQARSFRVRVLEGLYHPVPIEVAPGGHVAADAHPPSQHVQDERQNGTRAGQWTAVQGVLGRDLHCDGILPFWSGER